MVTGVGGRGSSLYLLNVCLSCHGIAKVCYACKWTDGSDHIQAAWIGKQENTDPSSRERGGEGGRREGGHHASSSSSSSSAYLVKGGGGVGLRANRGHRVPVVSPDPRTSGSRRRREATQPAQAAFQARQHRSMLGLAWNAETAKAGATSRAWPGSSGGATPPPGGQWKGSFLVGPIKGTEAGKRVRLSCLGPASKCRWPGVSCSLKIN